MDPKSDIVLGLLFATIGLSFAFAAMQYQGQSRLFPLGIGASTALLGAILVLRSTVAMARGVVSAPLTLVEDYTKFSVIILSAIGFALLVTRVGFFTTSVAYSLIVPWLLGFRRLVTLIVCSAAFTLVLYLVFVLALRYPLPRGVLI